MVPSSTNDHEIDPHTATVPVTALVELRAEVELLTRNRDAARMIIGPLSERPDLVDACEDVVREAAKFRAKIERWREVVAIFSAGNVALEAANERLRAEIVTWGEIWNNPELLAARVEALRDGTAQT